MEKSKPASMPRDPSSAWTDELWSTIRASAERSPQHQKLLPFLSWVLLADGSVAQAPLEVRSYLTAMEAAHDRFHEQRAQTNTTFQPTFDEERGGMVANEVFCSIPPNTIGFDVCRFLFSRPRGEKVDLEAIHMAIEGMRDGFGLTRQEAKKIYNAVQWVNRQIEQAFGVQSFFAYRGKQVWARST